MVCLSVDMDQIHFRFRIRFKFKNPGKTKGFIYFVQQMYHKKQTDKHDKILIAIKNKKIWGETKNQFCFFEQSL